MDQVFASSSLFITSEFKDACKAGPLTSVYLTDNGIYVREPVIEALLINGGSREESRWTEGGRRAMRVQGFPSYTGHLQNICPHLASGVLPSSPLLSPLVKLVPDA